MFCTFVLLANFLVLVRCLGGPIANFSQSRSKFLQWCFFYAVAAVILIAFPFCALPVAYFWTVNMKFTYRPD